VGYDALQREIEDTLVLALRHPEAYAKVGSYSQPIC